VDGKLANIIALENGFDNLYGYGFANGGFPLLAEPSRAAIAKVRWHSLVYVIPHEGAIAIRFSSLYIVFGRFVFFRVARFF